MKKVVITIPVYKKEPSNLEVLSFKQVLKVLKKYDIVVFTHASLDLRVYYNLANEVGKSFMKVIFDEEYFKSIAGYNRLMLSVDFYKCFSDYKYLLIYQLDAFVFRDELEYWCDKGYDYVGAPFFKSLKDDIYGTKMLGVGNGGFSLRRIDYCKKVLSLYRNKVLVSPLAYFYKDKFINALIRIPWRLMGRKNTLQWFMDNVNEDFIFSWCISNSSYSASLPSCDEALHFAFEVNPKYCYELTNGILPFGCHAFAKYEYDSFWKPIILAELGVVSEG